LLLCLLIHSIIIPYLLIHNTINLDSIYNQISFPMKIRYHHPIYMSNLLYTRLGMLSIRRVFRMTPH